MTSEFGCTWSSISALACEDFLFQISADDVYLYLSFVLFLAPYTNFSACADGHKPARLESEERAPTVSIYELSPCPSPHPAPHFVVVHAPKSFSSAP
jgi:hypothetical protein